MCDWTIDEAASYCDAMVGARVVVASMGVLAAACVDARAYACSSDVQCIVGDAQGWCEPEGYCSLPDDQCASGRRVVSLAPAEVAGSCVPALPEFGTSSETGEPPIPTTAPVPEGEDGDSSSEGSESGAEESSGSPSYCGDGVRDPHEACDDTVNDDACSSDCRQARQHFAAPGGDHTRGNDLALAPDGQTLVGVGWATAAGGGTDMLVVRFDLDLRVIDHLRVGSGDGLRAEAWGVAFDGDDIIVAGFMGAVEHAPGPDGHHFLGRFRPTDAGLELVWSDVGADASSRYYGVAIGGDGSILAAGMQDDRILIAPYDGSTVLHRSLDATSAYARAVAASEDGRWVVAGTERLATGYEGIWYGVYDASLDEVVAGRVDATEIGETVGYGAAFDRDGAPWVVGTIQRANGRELYAARIGEGPVLTASPFGDVNDGNDIAFGDDDRIWIAGGGEDPGSAYDALLLPYTGAVMQPEIVHRGAADHDDKYRAVAVDAHGHAYALGYGRDAAETELWLTRIAPF